LAELEVLGDFQGDGGQAPEGTHPEISISMDAGGKVIVVWLGVLQSAPDVTGPWTDVADDSQSPLTLTVDQAKLFQRSRNQ